MKSHLLWGACVFALMQFSAMTNAALIDRGNGMIYDDDLKITWLQNANAGAGSAFDDGISNTDGKMTWASAIAWSEQLVYEGFDDWRLPATNPINGVAYTESFSFDGSQDFGYNVSAPGSIYEGSISSEMAHLFYNTLGNISFYTPIGGETGCTNCLTDTGPFSEFQAFFYWSISEFLENPAHAWSFDFRTGRQDWLVKSEELYAWAVRDGDVAAVPAPATVWLFTSGLI